MKASVRALALPLLLSVSIAVLAGCQAVWPAAIRVNYDGSFDYVTCSDLEVGEFEWSASFTDVEGNRSDLPTPDEAEPVSAGRVYHFARPDGEWAFVDVGPVSWAGADADASEVALGQWRWNNEGGLFGTKRGEGDHCEIHG